MIPITKNLFNYINYDFSELGIDNTTLSFYFASKYNERWCNSVVELLMESDGTITNANLAVLGQYIKQLYEKKWDKLAALLTAQYDPIHNYLDDMTKVKQLVVDSDIATQTLNLTYTGVNKKTEEITDNDDKSVILDLEGTNSNTRTDNTTETTSNTRTDNTTRTDNLTRTDDLEQTRDVGTTNDRTDSVYGFNSSDAVPSEEKAGTGSVDETDTQSGTVRNTGTVTNTGTVSNAGTRQNTGTVGNSGSNTVDSTENTERDYTRERTVTHTGNIGNIATQDLMQKEVDFWAWNFVIQVISDVADVITLPTY